MKLEVEVFPDAIFYSSWMGVSQHERNGKVERDLLRYETELIEAIGLEMIDRGPRPQPYTIPGSCFRLP